MRNVQDQAPLNNVQDYVNLRKLTVQNLGAVGAALCKATATGQALKKS